jgi:hypothetical protein
MQRCLRFLALYHRDEWESVGKAPQVFEFSITFRKALSLTACPFYSRERDPGTYCIGGRLGSKAVVRRKLLTVSEICDRPAQSIIILNYVIHDIT